MRLEYTLKFRDYVLFNAVHQFLSVKMQAFCLLVAWLIYWMESKGDQAVAITIAVMGYLFLWVFQFVFTAFYLFSTKNKSLLTTHVVEVQDQAFYEETPFNRSFHYWPGIARVVRRPGFAAVYLSAVAAHIIPRRAFASDQQVDQFVALVEERMRAAQRTD
jgi:hypothetical protein